MLERADEEGPVKGDIFPSLRGLRADQVLTSRAFGLSETRNPAIEKKLNRFRELILMESLDDKQQIELTELRNAVEEEVPGLAEYEQDRLLERQLRERLADNPLDGENEKK